MIKDDTLELVLFSAQESVPELDEEALEEITGGGLLDCVKGCFGFGTKKAASAGLYDRADGAPGRGDQNQPRAVSGSTFDAGCSSKVYSLALFQAA